MMWFLLWIVGFVVLAGALASSPKSEGNLDIVAFLAALWPLTLLFIVGLKLGALLGGR